MCRRRVLRGDVGRLRQDEAGDFAPPPGQRDRDKAYPRLLSCLSRCPGVMGICGTCWTTSRVSRVSRCPTRFDLLR
jgi:hypothetical protein